MAKITVYVCRDCGKEEDIWIGQCLQCGAYNSFSKTTVERKAQHRATAGLSHSGYAGQQHHITKLNMVKMSQELRCSTGIGEFDRVLGGGLVTGSVVLIGGDPGIGKSTLLLQTATHIAKNQSVLYITGEESLSQVAMRAKRLGLPMDRLDVMAETKVERICEILTEQKTSMVILDSIQTLYTEAIPAASGSTSQIKESASILTRFAKYAGISLLIVGHVTKEKELAGPKVLEHMVDTVLYFEGEASRELRMLRGFKNRFGSTSEIGIFEMTAEGLISAKDIASKFFNKSKSQSGSALTVINIVTGKQIGRAHV